MSPIKMSRPEMAMRVVLAYLEALKAHDILTMMSVVSSDCVLESSGPAPDGAAHRGQASVAEFWQTHFEKSPQVRLEIEDAFSMGQHCIVRWRRQWPEREGATRHRRGADIFLVRDGLICEQLSYVKG